MGYVEKNLMPNERVIYSAKVNPAIFIPVVMSCAFGVLFLIVGMSIKETGTKIISVGSTILFFLISARLFIEGTIIMLTTELALTNRRVIAKMGFLHMKTVEILLSKVESINVYQNLAGKIFNFGTVTITGTGGTKESFKAIIDPLLTRKKIYQIIEQQERGMVNHKE